LVVLAEGWIAGTVGLEGGLSYGEEVKRLGEPSLLESLFGYSARDAKS